MSILKRMTSLIVIAAMASVLLIALWTVQQEESHAAIAKAAVKKAKTYAKAKNKLFKVKGAWYCFSKKKVKTGLQKVGAEYYFFKKASGKMLLKTQLKKVGTAYYYFKKANGKAPAFRKKAKIIKGKTWFFKANGKRYPYSYTPTGSAGGNIAAGMIISQAKLTPGKGAADAQLQKAYKAIVNRSSYQIVPDEPDLGSSAWIGKFAKACAVKKGGKCYHMAALTFVTFKALGAKPVLNAGKWQSIDAKKGKPTGAKSVHCWVELNNLVYDSVFDVSRGKKMAYMGKAKTEQQNGKYFVIDGVSDIAYFSEKTF